jgi:ABC-type glutathione transport system ATPase component
MSFTGAGSFGSYDRTAQTGGVPALSRQQSRTSHDVDRAEGTMSHDTVSKPAEPKEETVRERSEDTDTAAEDDDVADLVERERRNSMVQALARRYTRESHVSVPDLAGRNVFTAAQDEDSPLNPNGPKFSARAWAKAVVDMVSTEGHKFRTTGVAFQNLNVFGFGTATDYQKDVINVWLEVLGVARKVLGLGKRRIDILRDFDGVVHNGEMLVVLGPPGSGCSTLLKTIAGDYNGIFIDDKSYFNYQGKPWLYLCSENCTMLTES